MKILSNSFFIMIACFVTGCSSVPQQRPEPKMSIPPSKPSSPQSTLPQPNVINLKCAEQYISCDVQPVGSLIQSTQRNTLFSFWKTSCLCGEDCACINGLATGEGFARFCPNNELCTANDSYGVVSGKLSNGRFIAKNQHILVKIYSAKGNFSGEINSEGGYVSGVLEQLNEYEKFVGSFHENGSYKSGALYLKNKIILANKFIDNKPVGRVLTGAPDGTFKELDCNNNGCVEIKSEHSDIILEAFRFLAENKGQDQVLKSTFTLIGKAALSAHPALRTFQFLNNLAGLTEFYKSNYSTSDKI